MMKSLQTFSSSAPVCHNVRFLRKEACMLQSDELLTWELIRLQAIQMGWRHVLIKESIQHFLRLQNLDEVTGYQTLHAFYSRIATPTEQRAMLKAGYNPPC